MLENEIIARTTPQESILRSAIKQSLSAFKQYASNPSNLNAMMRLKSGAEALYRIPGDYRILVTEMRVDNQGEFTFKIGLSAALTAVSVNVVEVVGSEAAANYLISKLKTEGGLNQETDIIEVQMGLVAEDKKYFTLQSTDDPHLQSLHVINNNLFPLVSWFTDSQEKAGAFWCDLFNCGRPSEASYSIVSPNNHLGVNTKNNPSQNQITEMKVDSNAPSSQMHSEQVALEFAKALKNGEFKNIPLPQLRPTAKITITDGQGNSEEFEVIDGDPNQVLQKNSDGFGQLNPQGVTVGQTANGQAIAVIDSQATVNIDDPTYGRITLPAKMFFQMVGQRAEAFAKYMSSLLEATVEDVVSNFVVEEQRNLLIAEIIGGLILGEDIEDITKAIALRIVGDAVIDQLADLFEGQKGFELFRDLKENKVLASASVQAALKAVALTLILQGRRAGIKDYIRAAANASIKPLIQQNIDRLLEIKTISTTGQVITSSLNAGVATALVSVTSSIISGQGMNEDVLRQAATSAGVAAATKAIVGYMSIGSVAAGPVGIVISTVLNVALTKLFPSGAEKIYHSETLSHVTQPKPDGTGNLIIGVREAGALLRVGIGNDDVIGTGGDDVLVGNDQQNVLLGNDGDDMLEGRGDDDVLQAGTGHDHIEAGAGDDYVEGNDGNDRILGEEGDDTLLGGLGNDVIAGGEGDDKIEGEEGDDQISGDSGNDTILGGPGADRIHAGAGDDVIEGGTGDDVIDGSIGNDELHGGEGRDVLFGDSGDDLVRAGADDDVVYGDEGADVLYGDLGNDILDGGSEADLLYGGLGLDVLFGQEGDDHLYGEFDNDYLVGGKGNDLLNGGVGDDVYVFGRGDGKDSVEDSAGTQDIIRLANYIQDEITFSQDADDLILSSPDGSDQVTVKNHFTQSPIETLVFSDGRSIVLSGLIFDVNGTVTYNSTTFNATNILDQTSFAGTWQEAEEDRVFMNHNPESSWYFQNFDTSIISSPLQKELYNDVQVRATVIKSRSWYGRTRVAIHYSDFIETHLVGTPGADRIVGTNADETIDSLAGDDQNYANSGTDTINSGSGHDMNYGGSQIDIINCGDDHDKAYAGMANDVINGGTGNDYLAGEWGVDTIHGDNGDDYILGGEDGDYLYGDEGHDVLIGGDGADNLYGGNGVDYIIGDAGNDYAEGGAGDDYLEGGAGDDVLHGGSDKDILRGEDGSDRLYGEAGDDLLIGGEGADILDGGTQVDTISYAESDAAVQINLATGAASGGYAEGDTIITIENVIGTDYNDILIGDGNPNELKSGYGNDQIYGGGGDDFVQGGAGADYLDGGPGTDKVSYADSASGVEVDLVQGIGRFGHAEGDRFIGMEHFIGSKHDDTIIVGNSSITFEAGAGEDTVVLPGLAAEYEIILDRGVLTTKHLATNQYSRFSDIEHLTFDDVSYESEHFPGLGNSIISSIANRNILNIPLDKTTGANIVLEVSASHGSASLNPDNSFNYSPNTDYKGADSFSIRITDPQTNLISIQDVDVYLAPNQTELGTQYTANDVTSDQQIKPQFSEFNDGTFILAWETQGQSISVKRLNTNLDAISSETNLITLPTLSTGLSSVLVLGNGNYALGWSEYSGVTFGHEAIVAIFNSNHQEITRFNLFVDQTWHQTIAVLTKVDNNSFFTTWKDDSALTQYQTYGRLFQNNGLAMSVIFPIIKAQTNGIHAVTMLDKKRFVTSWSFSTSIHAQLMETNGRTLGNPFLVSKTNKAYQADPKIAAWENGDFIIAWYNSADGQSLIRKYNINGEALSDEKLLFSGLYPAVTALPNNAFAVTFNAQSIQTHAQIFKADLAPLTESFVIDANTATNWGESGSQVIFGMNGKINVVWTKSIINNPYDNNIYVRQFIADTRGVIKATPSNDALIGSTGDETFIGSHGPDLIDGGSGQNTLSYELADEFVEIDLQNNSTNGSYAVGDIVLNIQHLIGSSFNDTLIGNTQKNKIIAGSGNDVLKGGLSDDELFGGDDIDTALYSHNFSNYEILWWRKKIFINDTSAIGSEGFDTLMDIERIRFNDRIITLNEFPVDKSGVVKMLVNGQASLFTDDEIAHRFLLHTPPSFGNVLVHLNGTLTYTPNNNFIGEDSFSYISQNQLGLFRVQSIAIKVQGDKTGNSYIDLPRLTNTFMSNRQSEANVAHIPGIGYVVAWRSMNQDSSDWGIFGKAFDYAGNELCPETQLNSYVLDSQDGVHIAGLNNGNFIATWQSSGLDGDRSGIAVRIFNSRCEAITPEIVANTFTILWQQHPGIAALITGNSVVVWNGDVQANPAPTKISAVQLDAVGKRVGNTISVSNSTAGSENNPVVSGLQDGGFVIGWRNINIFYRIFNADNTPRLNIFNNTAAQVANTASNNGYNSKDDPQIAVSSTNVIGIIWAEQENGGAAVPGPYNVHMACYNADGSSVRSDFIVNTNQNGDQLGGKITAIESGKFYVVWLSDLPNQGVYTQLFDDTCQAIDSETFIETNGLLSAALSVAHLGKNRVALSGGDSNEVYTQIISLAGLLQIGSSGNDYLQTGVGDDELLGNRGRNVYRTGPGRDQITVTINPEEQDIIEDFDPASDVINLENYDYLINGYSDLQNYISEVNGNTQITFGNNHTIIIRGLSQSQLQVSHFIGRAAGNSLPVTTIWHTDVIVNQTATVDVLAGTSDLDNDILNISSVTQPLNGTIFLLNASLHYVPDINFLGQDNVVYVVSDGRGGETAQNLYFTVYDPNAIKNITVITNFTLLNLNTTISASNYSVGTFWFQLTTTTPLPSPYSVSPESAVPPIIQPSASSINPTLVPSVNPIPAPNLNPILASTISMPLPEASELNPASPPAPPVFSSANRLSNPFSSLFVLPATLLGGTRKIDNPSSMAEDNIPIDETLPDYHSTVAEQFMLFRLVGHYMKGWMSWNKARELTSLEADTLREHKTKLGLFYEKLTNFNDSIIESCGLFDEQLRWLDKSIREVQGKIHSVLKKTETTSSQWDELTNKINKIEKMLDGLTSKQQQLETLETESAKLAEQGKRYAICYDAINDILKIKVELIKEETTTCANLWEIPTKTPFGQQQQFWSNTRVHASVPEQLAVQTEEIRRLGKS